MKTDGRLLTVDRWVTIGYTKRRQEVDRMQFITIRDLRNKSAKIQADLPKEKEMVLTSNGKPIAIISATSPEKVEESLAMIRRMRAVEAVDLMHRRSVEAGTDRLTLNEINREIAAVRKGQRAK